MENKNSLPSKDKVKDLAKFTFEILKRAVANGGASLVVSNEVQRERLKVCKSCPKYDELQHMCMECGCNLAFKTKFALEYCPIMKWEYSDVDWVKEEYEHILNHIHQEIPKNIPNEPDFPNPRQHNLKLGDKYKWNYKEWEWNGKEWIRLTTK